MRAYKSKAVFTILVLNLFIILKSLTKENPTIIKPSPQKGIEPQTTYLERVKALTGCVDKPNQLKQTQRSFFWVLENYIKPDGPPPKCHETVTYATHGEFTYLHNLIPLLKRWMAPISLALYCPGTDYQLALISVIYLRKCLNESQLVKDFVTFHFYFNRFHLQNTILYNVTALEAAFDCDVIPPYLKVKPEMTYRVKNELKYHINVGRNIAREVAVTHFVLSSDIELYPSSGVAQDFIQMYARLNRTNEREVFVLPIFEVKVNATIPMNKTELQVMLENRTANIFHEFLCLNCHRVPKYNKWKEAPQTNGLDIFTTGKRTGPFIFWEPIYIGTNREPVYEESLTWEEQGDKMTQGYALCILNYDFHVLNNAFLVHRPGIKVFSGFSKFALDGAAKLKRMREYKYQLNYLYGYRKGCEM